MQIVMLLLIFKRLKDQLSIPPKYIKSLIFRAIVKTHIRSKYHLSLDTITVKPYTHQYYHYWHPETGFVIALNTDGR